MKRRRTKPAVMFPAGDALPLFSGTCQREDASPYQPAERAGEQARLPGVETRPEMKGSNLRSQVAAYIAKIKQPHKRDYALAYAEYREQGSTGEDPQRVEGLLRVSALDV